MNNCEPPEINKGIKYKTYAVLCASALLVASITFFVYIPALQNGFVNWDDGIYVYGNNNITSLDYKFLKWVLTSVVNANWHPLTVFSYALDYAFWGLNPFGYHLTSIIFHTANTLLVFILVIKLMNIASFINNRSKIPTEKLFQRDGWINNSNLTAAIITALLFGIHPLHVESVVWVSERKDVLYSFFYILSILFYIKYAFFSYDVVSYENCNKWRNIKFYAVSVIFFILSILSKPMAVSLPFVLFLLDIYPLKRCSLPYLFPFYRGEQNYSTKRIFIEKSPFIIISFLSSLAAIWMHKKEGILLTIEASPIITRLFIPMRNYIFYLCKMILPINLAPLYAYPKYFSLFSLEYLGAFLLVLLITYICLRVLFPIFSIVWFYYLITLLPVIGIVQFGAQSAADRYTYLPILGFFILAGIGMQNLINRYSNKRYVMIFLVAGLIGIFAIMANLTVKQISIWKDSMTLWSYDIKLFPDTAYIAYNNRGVLSNYEQGISDFNMAIKINPMFAMSYYNRGVAYFKVGNLNRSIEDYGTAVQLDSKYKDAYYGRGISYYKSGNYKQSILDYDKVIELDNKYAWAYNNRANVYRELGNYQEALKDYKNAIQYDPNITEAYNNLGLVYLKLGDSNRAAEFYKKAEQLGLKDNHDAINK